MPQMCVLKRKITVSDHPSCLINLDTELDYFVIRSKTKQ